MTHRAISVLLGLSVISLTLITDVSAQEQRWQQIPAVPTDVSKVNISTPIFSQRFIFAVPGGWKPVFEHPSLNHYILEYIPNDQKLDSWRDMITVQGLKNIVKQPNMTPELLLEQLADHIGKNCETKVAYQRFAKRVVDSYESASAIIAFGQLPSDQTTKDDDRQSESAYYIAIKGNNDYYVLHRAIRRSAFVIPNLPLKQSDLATWYQDFQPIKLCDMALPEKECWEKISLP